jgi:hypothetical protein
MPAAPPSVRGRWTLPGVDSKYGQVAKPGSRRSDPAGGCQPPGLARLDPRARSGGGAAGGGHPSPRGPARDRRSSGRRRGGPESGRLPGPQRGAGQRPPPQGRRVRGATGRVHDRCGGAPRERPRAPAHRAAPRGGHHLGAGPGPRVIPPGARRRGHAGGQRPGDPQVARRRGTEPGGLPLPGHLPVRARHVRRGDAGPDGATHAQPAECGAPGQGQDPGARRPQAVDAGLDHRARGGRSRRAAADLGGVLEPAEPGHAAAGRPHRAVRGGQGAPHADARRSADRPSVQHVRAPGPAAGADREPGPAGHRGGARPGAGQVPLLRRSRRPPTHLFHNGGRAQPGGVTLSAVPP